MKTFKANGNDHYLDCGECIHSHGQTHQQSFVQKFSLNQVRGELWPQLNKNNPNTSEGLKFCINIKRKIKHLPVHLKTHF